MRSGHGASLKKHKVGTRAEWLEIARHPVEKAGGSLGCHHSETRGAGAVSSASKHGLARQPSESAMSDEERAEVLG